MGPIGFAPTMTCSMAMVYFTMDVWLFLGYQEIPSDANLGIYRSIQQLSRSDIDSFTELLSCSWQLAACGDNIRRSQCQSYCLASLS